MNETLSLLPPEEKSSSEPTDAELLRRARAGDERAFRTIIDRYEAQVAATVVGMIGRGPDAEEIGQRVFIRFYEALDDFREEASLGTFLTRIAMNLCLNEKRRQKRWYRRFISRDRPDPVYEPAAPPEKAAEQAELQRVLEHALDDLSEGHRAVVVLRLIEGRSTSETAEVLGIAEGTVLSRLSRARSQLREHLEPYVQDFNTSKTP